MSDSKVYTEYNNLYSNGTSTLVTSYDWEVHFFKAPPIMTGDSNIQSAADKVLNNTFKLRTVAWSAPDINTNTPVTTSIRGHQLSQPGMTQWSGNAQFQAQDFADEALTKYFTLLSVAQDDPYTHSTNGRSPNTFRFGFDIYRCNPQGFYIQRWHCDPCVLIDVNIPNQGSSAKQNLGYIGLSFLIDFFTIQFPKNNTPTNSQVGNDWTDYGIGPKE